MARYENPYYNPMWKESAGRLVEALYGNPEKAGQIAYQKAQERLTSGKADRQEIENNALTGGLEEAINMGGGDPTKIADSMGTVLQSMAAAGVANPSNYTAPWWAMNGMAQSGASPAESLVRAAYAGSGKNIPKDLALTPERQDEIRNDEQAADYDKAVAVQNLRNLVVNTRGSGGSSKDGAGGGGGKAPKPPGYSDIDKVLASVFAGVPGATSTDQYRRTHLDEDLLSYLNQSDIYEKLRTIASDNYDGGSETARQAVLNALQLPSGAQFDSNAVLEEGSWLPYKNTVKGPGFVSPEGGVIDIGELLANAGIDLQSVASQVSSGPVTQDPALSAAPNSPAPRQAADGKYYIPDPARPGKYLRVDP